VDQPEVLVVAEQVQPAAQHRVVDGLAAVAGDGTPLPVAGDPHRDVQLARVAAGESGAQFGVEPLRDRSGQRPGQDRQAAGAGGGQRRLGGAAVVGVPGDPAGIEDQQVAGVFLADHPQDVAGQLVERYRGEAAVGVAVQLDPGQPQLGRGGLQLLGSDH